VGPIQGRADTHVSAPAAIDKMVHGARLPCVLVRFLVVLQVMSVTGHDDVHLMFAEQLMDRRKGCGCRAELITRDRGRTFLGQPFSSEGLVLAALVPSAGIERMTKD